HAPACLRPAAGQARGTVGIPCRAGWRGHPWCAAGVPRCSQGRPEVPARSHTSRGVTGVHILVVEDDAELRDLLKRGLQGEGIHVETTATGTELLKRVEAAVPDAFVIAIG